MRQLKDNERNAYFECCIAVSSPDLETKTACATCEGKITEKSVGGSGLGYDPVFIKHEYSKSQGILL